MNPITAKRASMRQRIYVLFCGLAALVIISAALLAARIALSERATIALNADTGITDAVSGQDALVLSRVFPTATDSARLFRWNFVASPQLIELKDIAPFLLAAPSSGVIAALEPHSGRTIWNMRLPRQRGHEILLQAAPVQVDDRLVVVYMSREQRSGNINHHHAAVIDLRRGTLDHGFPVIELTAEVPASSGVGVVRFDPSTQYTRSALSHIPSQTGLGHVYVAFGAIRDMNGWHGWLLELDLDAWRLGPPHQAISAAFVTTPETDCDDGTNDKICGGGIWAYSGPQIHHSENGFEIVVQTGNGRLDLERGDYAQSLLRLRPGLEFTPACNPQLCTNVDPTDPSPACLSSCKDLFVPRLLPDDMPLRPSDGSCDDKSYLQCLEVNDWDFGANAPLRIELPGGPAVYVAAGKAGDVFLIDADNLGTLYDRRQAATLCGTVEDPCPSTYEGVIMTQPQAGWVDGSPVVVIPTYNPDESHPAGVVAYKIVTIAGQPRFEDLWRVPDPSTPEAKRWFRDPPTRAIVQEFEGEPVAWVADNAREGRVLGIRLRDGQILANVRTAGWPMRNARPVIYQNILYVPTGFRESLTWIEAFRITRRGS